MNTSPIYELAPLSSSLENFENFNLSIGDTVPENFATHIQKGDWTIGNNMFVHDNQVKISFTYSQEGWITKSKELRASLRQMKKIFKRRGFNIDTYSSKTKIMELCFSFHIQPIIDMIGCQMMENGGLNVDAFRFLSLFVRDGLSPSKT